MKRYEHNAVMRPVQDVSPMGVQRPEGQREAKIEFDEIWDTLRRGRWIIFLTCILVTGAISAYTFWQAPVYKATSIVAIEDHSRGAATIINFGERRDLASEIGVLEYSAELATLVAKQMKETAAAVESKSYFPVLLDEQGELLSDRAAGQHLFEMVDFTPVSQRNMIQISVRSEVPEEASTIANLYAQTYQQYSLEKSRASVTAARRFLEDQAEKRREEIRSLENQWTSFAQSNEVVTQEENGNRVLQEYTALEQRRNELAFALEQEEKRLSILQGQLNNFEPELRTQVVQEQETTELRNQIQALNTQIAGLKAQAEIYYINNASLREQDAATVEASGFAELAGIKRQIAGYDQRKDELVERLIAKASAQDALLQQGGALMRIGQLRERITEQQYTVEQLESQIKALDGRLAGYDSKLQDIPRQRIERKRLEQKLAQAETFYNEIASRLQQIIIKEESELGYVRQVRSAFVPTVPVSPNVQQNILLGVLLGLGFGVGLAFLHRSVVDRLRTPEDVHNEGYSLIGVIPKMDAEINALFKGEDTLEIEGQAVSTRLLPMLSPWSPIAENYRLIRANMQYAFNGADPQVIMITSPEQGDGKTVTAVNLAITMAQSGKRTICVDADLRRPNAHRLLGLNQEPGVAELLQSGGSFPDYIVPTNMDGLHFLPSGKPDIPPAELLGSDRMEDLIEYLCGHYDKVIIDSPPVLAVSDPVLLARKSDATILVVAADRTNVQAIQVAEKTLNAVGVPISGVVFNRFENDKARGYGYGYGYKSKYAYSYHASDPS